MKENSNKILVYNTIVLYGRLVITLFCGLFSTRYALQALGANDYGLYSVVASIIIFASIVNTSLLSACNRFLASAIGEGIMKKINETFNVSLIIHVILVVLFLLFSPIGHLYILNCVNYSGNIDVAVKVFYISVFGSAISVLGVPFNSILMAKEKFSIFCVTEAFFSVVRLIMCYLLIYYFSNKLLVYAAVLSICTSFPTIIYIAYCRKFYSSFIKFIYVSNKSAYFSILKFSIWSGFGAVAQVGQAQSISLFVNAFFNTLMNTALGIGNYMKSAVLLLSDNLTKSISPQITKNYASGNIGRCVNLMVLMSRISFISTFIISTPFIMNTEFILKLWLGSIPEYAPMFVRIMMFTIIIGSFNKGISEYIFATGNIKWYQLIVNSIILLSILVGYILLKMGGDVYLFLLFYLFVELVNVFIRQYMLKKVYGFDCSILYKESYYPSMKVVIISLPIYYLGSLLTPWLALFVVFILQLLTFYIFGLRQNEQKIVNGYLKNYFKTKF